jgi:hypothetical protein
MTYDLTIYFSYYMLQYYVLRIINIQYTTTTKNQKIMIQFSNFVFFCFCVFSMK